MEISKSIFASQLDLTEEEQQSAFERLVDPDNIRQEEQVYVPIELGVCEEIIEELNELVSSGESEQSDVEDNLKIWTTFRSAIRQYDLDFVLVRNI